jgi:exonuclease SbcD
MRILHTGDWHVGRLLRGRSRADEHAAVLAEIAEIAGDQQVDLVLVAGDLFDTAAPTPESERIVYQALLDLAGTGASVIVISGNHDSERRLQAVAPLLHLGRVITRAVFARPDAGGVLAVDSRDGRERALVAALPFLSQRHVVRADELMAQDQVQSNLQYAERVRRLLTALTQGFSGDTVNLVLAHGTMAGAEPTGSERASQTVFDYALDATVIPATTTYAALGHLHRQQLVPGPAPTWYSGSPLMLDFGETADRKGVLLIDAEPGLPASVMPLPLTAGRRLLRIEGDLSELRVLAGGVADEWLKVVVREPLRAGLADEVRALFPGAVDIAVQRAPDERPTERVASRRGRTPRELFADYLGEHGVDDLRLTRLFDELLEEVSAR